MPVLQNLCDVYLRNPGLVEMTTLRGRIHRVVPVRRREYKEGLVLTLVLRDLLTPKQLAELKEQQSANAAAAAAVLAKKTQAQEQEQEEEQEQQPPQKPANQNNGGEDDDDDDDGEFTLESGGNDQEKKESKKDNREKAHQSFELRVFFFDDFASALSFASEGDVLEIRTQFRVFLNPDSDGRPVFHGGRQSTEHLVTATEKSEVSIFSKSDRDVIELMVNIQNVKGEPVARVAHGVQQYFAE